jgi:hypothetical protein
MKLSLVDWEYNILKYVNMKSGLHWGWSHHSLKLV